MQALVVFDEGRRQGFAARDQVERLHVPARLDRLREAAVQILQLGDGRFPPLGRRRQDGEDRRLCRAPADRDNRADRVYR